MPWSAADAQRHTRKAKTLSRKRQWAKVANAVLIETGDEGRAVLEANAAVKRAHSKPKKART